MINFFIQHSLKIVLVVFRISADAAKNLEVLSHCLNLICIVLKHRDIWGKDVTLMTLLRTKHRRTVADAIRLTAIAILP
jgi:hypothetical protein